ncbi:PiggyBac transposable element-derived protein, partial [Trinorchestia longiramus]
IPSKPKKWGFKFVVLCDSGGFIHDFLLYTGKVDPVDDPNIPNLGPSSNCVLQLAQVIPPGKNHLLYFDNWFSSLPLIQFLSTKQIFCCGTIRPPRLAGLKLGNECDKELLKQGKGSLEERTTEQGGNTISYARWCDKRVVNIVSNFAASQPIGTVSRWDSKGKKYVDVQCPNIIQLYNNNMGGVDLADCLISLYRITITSKKYYHRFIFHMIDMAIVNAWLLYRRQAQKLSIFEKDISPLALFKLRIAVSLMKSGNISFRPRRGRPSALGES